MTTWHIDPVKPNWKIELVGGRSLTIEKTAISYDLWYGSPGRRLRVGANLWSLEEAKQLGNGLLVELLRKREFMEKQA